VVTVNHEAEVLVCCSIDNAQTVSHSRFEYNFES
jgi:hypothetical protein